MAESTELTVLQCFKHCDRCPGSSKKDDSEDAVCPKFSAGAECWYQIHDTLPDLMTADGIIEMSRRLVRSEVHRYEQAVREENFADSGFSNLVTNMGAAVRQSVESLAELCVRFGYIQTDKPPELAQGSIHIDQISLVNVVPELVEQINRLRLELESTQVRVPSEPVLALLPGKTDA